MEKKVGRPMTDLSGCYFGRLKAIHPVAERKFNNVVWLCQCSCGNQVEVRAAHLISGHTKSCGCLKKGND